MIVFIIPKPPSYIILAMLPKTEHCTRNNMIQA